MTDENKARWSRLISDFESTDLSQPEFAQERGVSVHSLRYWLYQLRKEARASAASQSETEKPSAGPAPLGDHPNPASSEITDSGESNPASSGITDSNRLKDSSRSICAPYQDFIEERRTLGRNAMVIYQDLVDRFGFRGRYHCVRRFIRTLEGSSQVEARAVIQTAPGEEGQVDYGEGPWVRHPQTGKYRRPRLFVFMLGCSRKSVRFLIWKSSSKGWAELHERAFRRLGGAPRVIVHDTLREGVLKPDVYDSTLNPLYRDVLKHYGVIALPNSEDMMRPHVATDILVAALCREPVPSKRLAAYRAAVKPLAIATGAMIRAMSIVAHVYATSCPHD